MSTFDGILREFPWISVDHFARREGVRGFFLSHCHSDHMTGLAVKKWPASLPIYCSMTSANMLRCLGQGKYRGVLKSVVDACLHCERLCFILYYELLY